MVFVVDIPLSEAEQKIIDAVLKFANLRHVESVGQVLRVLMPAVKANGSPIILTIPEADLGAFDDDRAQLLQWLDTIGRRRPTKADRENIWGNLRMVLKDTVRGDATWALTPEGTLASTAHPVLDGVQACTAFAAALLLDRNRRLHRWLQQCGLPECGKWFFDWRPRGAPRKFCCAVHAAKSRQLTFARKHRRRK